LVKEWLGYCDGTEALDFDEIHTQIGVLEDTIAELSKPVANVNISEFGAIRAIRINPSDITSCWDTMTSREFLDTHGMPLMSFGLQFPDGTTVRTLVASEFFTRYIQPCLPAASAALSS